jgi:uncharacterized protein YkwD
VTAFSLFSSFHPLSGLDDEILKYTNQFRQSRGLSPLIMNDELCAIARKHSQDMASGRRAFGHGGFDKREKQIEKLFDTDEVAENVAFGQNTARDVVTQWKNSSGHRKNMLGKYKYIGIGIARDRQGHYYFTQIFTR